MRRVFLLFLWLLLPMAAQALAAGDTGGWSSFWQRQQAQPVQVNADHLDLDQEEGSFVATGSVRLVQGEIRLQADRVEWHQDLQQASAVGGVRLDTKYSLLTGDELQINLGDGSGHLHRGQVVLKDRPFVLTGALIEKIDAGHYHLERGEFTTCNEADPAWHVGAREVHAYPDLGYATGRDAVFYLSDLPVMYAPFFFVPIGDKRQTGFLLPRAGFSERRGTIAAIPFYWAFARNQDATFYLDYLSRLGLGKGVDYRYVFGEANRGEARYYHINGFGEAADRYATAWEHFGISRQGWRLAADVEYVSSKDYFEDFGEAAKDYTKDESRSELLVSKSWDGQVLTGRTKYLRSLVADNDTTLQRLPEVHHDLLPHSLGDLPVYLEWNGSATYFWRREGETGGRLLFVPSLWADLSPVPGISLRPEVSLLGRLYRVADSESDKDGDLLPTFGLQTAGDFSRVYPMEEAGGWLGFRHTVEPRLSYRFLPEHDQSGLPQFDMADRLAPQSRIGYRFDNRVVGKFLSPEGGAMYREVLYLGLSQFYEMADLTVAEQKGEGLSGKLSPLRAEFQLRPAERVLFEGDLSYDLTSRHRDWTDIFLGTSVKGNRGDRLDLGWRYRRDEFSYLEGELTVSWFSPVFLRIEERFDLDARNSFEELLEAEYRGSCWSVKLSYRDRDDDREYLFSFSLSGLGNAVRFGGDLDGGNPLFE